MPSGVSIHKFIRTMFLRIQIVNWYVFMDHWTILGLILFYTDGRSNTSGRYDNVGV